MDTNFSKGQINHKTRKWELLFIFATHYLDMIYPPVKFHKSLPYGSGVLDTQFRQGHSTQTTEEVGDVMFLTHCLDFYIPRRKVQWICLIEFSYGWNSNFRKVKITHQWRKQELSFLFRNTLSWYDIPTSEDSRIFPIWFRSYDPA